MTSFRQLLENATTFFPILILPIFDSRLLSYSNRKPQDSLTIPYHPSCPAASKCADYYNSCSTRHVTQTTDSNQRVCP